MGQRKRVLLLDDYPDTVEALGAWFHIEGWLPLKADTEVQALSILAGQRPDVVILEPFLKTGDGMEVARAARALLSGNVRLIAMTGHQEWAVSSPERGLFDRCLLKPVPEYLLRDAVGISN